MGRKQRNAGAWALDVYNRQLKRSEEEKHRLQRTSEGIRSVVSFYSAQNSALREQLDAVEEELHRVRQKLAAYDELEGDAAIERATDNAALSPSQSGVHRMYVPAEAPTEQSAMASKTVDDLTLIRGVDELTEQVLNSLGLYTFRQIVELEADGWEHLAMFVPALAHSMERVRWRHDAESLCHQCGAAESDAGQQAG